MKKLLTLFSLCLTLAWGTMFAANAQAATVQLTEGEHQIVVKIDGEDFTVFHNDPRFPKPFFAPVRGPGGTVLTRPIVGIDANPDDKLDHVHHKGIWLSVDEINGNKHWAEKQKIVNASTTIVEAEGNPAVLDVVNQWVDDAGNAVVTESTRISIYANRLVTYDITFSAGDEMVEFEDTKEGLFGFRMVDSMREKEGGRVVNADGMKGTAECWGKPSAWVDYCGEVDGKTFGVTLFDHPLNFRPSRYHVRDYGLFSINPFGEKAYTGGAKPADAAIIPAGGTLRLRYGLYIHAGDAEAAGVGGVYHSYLLGEAPVVAVVAQPEPAAETPADEPSKPAATEVPDAPADEPAEAAEESDEQAESADEESDSGCAVEDDCECDPCARGKRRHRRCRGC